MQVEPGSPAPGPSEDSRPSTPQPYTQDQSREECLAGIGMYDNSSLTNQDFPSTRNAVKNSVQISSLQKKSATKKLPDTSLEDDQPAPVRGIKRAGTDSYQQRPHRQKDAPSTPAVDKKHAVQEAEHRRTVSEADDKDSGADSDDLLYEDTNEIEGKGKRKN